jgi:hypothetical protein
MLKNITVSYRKCILLYDLITPNSKIRDGTGCQ